MKFPASTAKINLLSGNYKPLLGGGAVLHKRDIDADYRRIRNKLRKFSAVSIIDAALDSLHHHMQKSKLLQLQSAPWVGLLLVKWAVQDNMVLMRASPRMPVALFDAIRQEIWNLSRPEDSKPNIYAMLRQMFAGQMDFQKRISWSFMRTPMLVSELSQDHPARKLFTAELGIEPEDFMDISMGLYAAMLNGEMHFNVNTYFQFAPSLARDVQKFFALLARDPHALRADLQSEELQRNRGSSELYEFPIFRRFPFILRQPDVASIWHPAVFSRGLEDAVHIILSNKGEEYSRLYSSIHERYVVDLVTSLDGPYISEDAQRHALVSGSQVEAIVPFAEGLLLVEAKLTLYNDGSLFSVNEAILSQATKRIREGIKQLRKVALQNLTAPWAQGGQQYGLIVANTDLHLYTAERLARIAPSPSLNDEVEGGSLLPLERIFIISVSEMEDLVRVSKQAQVSIIKILEKAVLDNRDPQTQKGYLSQIFSEYVQRFENSPLLEEASEQSLARMAAKIGASGLIA